MTRTHLFMLFISMLPAWPAQAQPPAAGVRIEQTEIDHTKLGAPHAAQPAHGQTALSPVDRATAAIWGLERQEYMRYQSLMRGPRGAFSVPNISPLEVLGIHARTPAERRKYAERLVRLMNQDIERSLAWERETQATWKRLYPNVPVIDPARLPRSATGGPGAPSALVGKRLALFVSTTCPSCRQAMPTLLKLAGEGGPAAGLDIYVVDSDDPDVIRAFARESGVDLQQVRSRRITLNQGRALFASLKGAKVVPRIFVRDGGRLVPIPGLMPGDSS